MGVGLKPDAVVMQACADAARSLAAAGAIVEPIAPFLTDAMLDGMCRFFEARSHNDFIAMSAERQAKVLPFIQHWCTWRAGGFSGAQLMHAYAQIQAMREAATRAMIGFDFLLMPTSPRLSYPATQESPGNDPQNALSHGRAAPGPRLGTDASGTAALARAARRRDRPMTTLCLRPRR